MMWGTAVQVSGTHVVPTSLQTQNFITDTLLTLLASDHVFLMRLTMVKEVTLPNNQGSATMTYIMQKSSDTVPIGTVCSILGAHVNHISTVATIPLLVQQHCRECMDCCMLTILCDLHPCERQPCDVPLAHTKAWLQHPC